MNVLVTGAAGFIGYHLVTQLCKRGDHVIGIDNLNEYYDVNLKKARLNQLKSLNTFEFLKLDIANQKAIIDLFKNYHFDVVVHLAAQAGVRYSLENPSSYINSNLVGFGNILEGCRSEKIKHLVFASSSSVYGANTSLPFSENDHVDHPISLYAATKKANELMAHAYAHLYKIPCTGLRFFTVYGPWGRPDMALFKFTKNILEGKPIEVYNNGNMLRDFTYIDDIIDGLIRSIDNPAKPNLAWSPENPTSATSLAPYRLYNLGNGNPKELIVFIKSIEEQLGKKAIKKLLPIQAGDVSATHANIELANKELGYKPKVSLENGIKAFVSWYVEFYQVDSDK